MKKMHLAALTAILLAQPALASDVFVGQEHDHNRPNASYERHAERFSFDGVRCTGQYIPMKSVEGGWTARNSVDCQE